MFKSPRTTIAGIAAILTALGSAGSAYASGADIDFGSLVAAIIAGIGLIAARDAKTSSEQQGIK